MSVKSAGCMYENQLPVTSHRPTISTSAPFLSTGLHAAHGMCPFFV